MLCQGTVAGFAGNVGVAAGGAGLGLVIMAKHASVLAGIVDRPRPDHLQGRGPVVAVFTEVLGDHRGADHQKCTKPGQEHQGGADQMA